MKEQFEWEKDLAICNEVCSEIMDKFWDQLMKEKVEFPEGTVIITTRNDISRANSDKTEEVAS